MIFKAVVFGALFVLLFRLGVFTGEAMKKEKPQEKIMVKRVERCEKLNRFLICEVEREQDKIK